MYNLYIKIYFIQTLRVKAVRWNRRSRQSTLGACSDTTIRMDRLLLLYLERS